MAIIPNSQSFNPAASGTLISSLSAQFHASMDTVLVGMGRDVTIHLPPTKTPCPSSECVFNSFYKRYMGTNEKICEACKGQGFVVETRQTVYTANLRWTDEPFNESRRNIEEKQPVGRMGQNFLRMKTVAVSHDHIRQSIGATVDTINCELFEEPRYTGFGGQLFYVISWWKVVNR